MFPIYIDIKDHKCILFFVFCNYKISCKNKNAHLHLENNTAYIEFI